MVARNPQISLKPQDLVLLFKLACHPETHFTYASYSKSLAISASELHACVDRLTQAQLVMLDENRVTVAQSILLDFIIYGAVHFFPAVMGPATRGIPTAYAAPPLNELINQPDEMVPVWPDSKGEIRGLALYPLYPSVPAASRGDSKLYEVCALFDALRAGAARERELAIQLLRERL